MSQITVWKFAAILLAVCCSALIYQIFDTGITRTYQKADQETQSLHISVLSGLLTHEWLGMTEAEVLIRLKNYSVANSPNSFVFGRETGTNVIFIESVRFEFQNGRLHSLK